jgi:hypothetical protein
MDRKFIVIITISLVVIVSLITYGFLPKYKFIYIYSSDKRNVITQIERHKLGKNKFKTIFTPGKYNKKEIPDVKIVPQYNSGLTDGFTMILEWRQDTAIIYSYNYECITRNLTNKFRYKKMRSFSKEDSILDRRQKKDSNNFILLHNIKW